jgi:hypothetical protein
MRATNRIALIVSVVAATAAAPAQASLIAGWDFSQWLAAGALTTDGSNGANTLSANYSSLDPTNNAGNESAAFGILLFDGSSGSTEVTPDGTGTEAFVPSPGSLVSNLNGTGNPSVPFDSEAVLTFENPNAFYNLLSMTAQSVVSVVFKADLSSIQGALGEDWEIVFGGLTFDQTASVGVEYSTNGTSYTSAGTANLTTTDTPYSFDLSNAGSSNMLFVRLNFTNAGPTNLPAIDNVAINATTSIVPEPGTALLLVSGLAGLVRYGRRRA